MEHEVEELGLVEVDDGLADDEDDDRAPHRPYADWQPFPQYASVEPL